MATGKAPLAMCPSRPDGCKTVQCRLLPGHDSDHFWQSLDLGVRWRWSLTNSERRARKREARHAA